MGVHFVLANYPWTFCIGQLFRGACLGVCLICPLTLHWEFPAGINGKQLEFCHHFNTLHQIMAFLLPLPWTSQHLHLTPPETPSLTA